MNRRLLMAIGSLAAGVLSNAVLWADPPSSALPAKSPPTIYVAPTPPLSIPVAPNETAPSVVRASPTADTDVRVALGIRIVAVPDKIWAHDKSENTALAPTKRGKVAYLKGSDLSSLVMTLYSNQRSEIERVPTLSVLSGQTAALSTMEDLFFLTGVEMVVVGEQSLFVPQNRPYKVGFEMSATPRVSSDRCTIGVDLKAVRIRVDENIALLPVEIPLPHMSEKEEGGKIEMGPPVPFKMFFQQPRFSRQDIEQKLVIPTGETALIVAGDETRSVEKVKLSIASMIPNGDELFGERYFERERRTVLLLVTPRLQLASEIAAEVPGAITPHLPRATRDASEQSEAK